MRDLCFLASLKISKTTKPLHFFQFLSIFLLEIKENEINEIN